jgi:prepilin-type processing-associated H-X9-DG protein
VGSSDWPIDTMFQGSQVYPEYLTDLNVLLCPSDSDQDIKGWYIQGDSSKGVAPCNINAHSYNYWGWALSDNLVFANPSVGVNLKVVHLTDLDTADADLVKFMMWAQTVKTSTDPGPFDQDYGKIYRLREGIERFFITDINNPAASAKAQSSVWIMWDDVQSMNPSMMNHVPGGCNVLYMDGHVQFIKYGTESPVSFGMVQVLSANIQ